MQPLVSILIPAYNAERWIADTLASARAQTWPRVEIVVVDDGSTDATLAIARHYASPSVEIVSQRNQGAAAARNRALAVSQGDYVQWLDADDLLAPDKVQAQMESAGARDSRMLLSSAWGSFTHRPWKAKFTPSVLWQDLPALEWVLRKMEHDAYMQTATWLVSRQLTDAAGPWDVRLLGDDDGEYFCRVVLASAGVKFVAQSKVLYRTIIGGLGYVGTSSRKLETNLFSVESQIGYVRAVADDERVRAACLTFLERDLRWYYPHRLDLAERCDALATSLGRRLRPPSVPKKYAWIEHAFGLGPANRAQLAYNLWKLTLLGAVDRLAYRMANGRGPGALSRS
jgi:glycosyltransferase involved in cell wall biosynthesis